MYFRFLFQHIQNYNKVKVICSNSSGGILLSFTKHGLDGPVGRNLALGVDDLYIVHIRMCIYCHLDDHWSLDLKTADKSWSTNNQFFILPSE